MTRGVRNLTLALAGLALAGAVVGAVALTRTPRISADVRIIAHGERVDLDAHVVAGKYTVFDFYAPWCPPCRVLGPALERLAERRPESLAIRKVDIVDWTMPVATQHGIESLPFLVLYDPQGHRMAAGEEVYDALARIFGNAAREVNDATHVPAESAPAGDDGSGGPARTRL